MAKNEVFRVYNDEETMLKVYNRRLRMADTKFGKRKPELKKYLDRYGNEAEADQVNEDGHRVTVTEGIGVIDTMYASMTAIDVEFLLENIGNGTQEQAMAATRALNQGWHDTKGQKRAKKAIKDALIVDQGWVKVYYDYVEDIDLQDVPEDALRAQLQEFFGERAGEVGEDEVKAAIDNGDVVATVENTIVLRDRVCVEYVPWDLIRYDQSAKDISDVRWVAQYTQYPNEEVKNHPVWLDYVKARYGQRKGAKMMADLEGDARVTGGLDIDAALARDFGEDTEGDDERITVVEMWDFETGVVTVFPKGHDDLVLHQRANPLMFNLDLEDRNPFKPLIVRDDPRAFEGLGDMRIIYPGLEELDEYRSNQATYVARTIPKLFGPSGALTQAGKNSLKSPVWGEFVELEAGHNKDSIGQVQLPSLPQEAYGVPEQVKMELRDATGVSEPMRGVFPEKRTTATETQIVTGKGDQRQSERRSALEEWYLSIARTMLQLMQKFYDQKRMLRYTDDLGQEFVWEWTKEDIALDADLKIALTPRENLTREERSQRALQFMNLALPLPETDRGELLKFVAREMGMRDDVVRAIVKSDQEVQLEQQQQQMQAGLSAAPPPGSSPPGLNIGTA
jgi:hypothetical protein